MSEADVSKAQTVFPAFRWPMPTSFAAAVAANRFELGDVLYADAAAYAPWREAAPAARAIQVLDPPRSARSALRDGDSDRRQANWASDVRVALVDCRAGTSEERVISQGKLVMALWRGDPDWLDPDRAEPEYPRTARELQARLEDGVHAFRDEGARRRPRHGAIFVMVVDLASDASRVKAEGVFDRLRASGRADRIDRTPVEAGLEGAALYHPTLVLRGFVAPGRALDAVEADLRASLYRGGSAAIDSGAANAGAVDDAAESEASDRFSVARHGRLIEY